MKQNTKEAINWFFVFLLIIFIFVIIIPAGSTFKNYKIQQEINEKLKKMDSSLITEKDIISTCNNHNKTKIILCLNKIHKEHVTYDGCKNRSNTHILKPMELINIGSGCCRDSAEYYSYFLDKFNIPNQKVYTPPKPHATHVFIVASLTTNNTHIDYKIDGNDLKVIFYSTLQ